MRCKAAFIAEGTSSEKIRFFGENGGTFAVCNYIRINTEDARNKLNHVYLFTNLPTKTLLPANKRTI